MLLRPLTATDLPAATRLLGIASPYYRAGDVAAEKLFGAAPNSDGPSTIGVDIDGELAGIASIDGNRIRVLAVAPTYRERGIGAQLLAWCEHAACTHGHPRIWALGQAGNYLAPGIDAQDQATIGWLRRRHWREASDIRTNLIVAVHDNPLVTPARAHDLSVEASTRGYDIRRARPDETRLLAAIGAEFGGAWPFEVERALRWRDGELTGAVHVAVRGDDYCAFAAHNGNNSGLGWFGPAGTWPAHRGQRLGEAVLLACLLDVARQQATCEIAWIGPEPFYQKSCGIIGRRMFVPMKREFTAEET